MMTHTATLAIAALTLAVCSFVAGAQSRRELNLRGDRFAPLTWDQLSPAQRALVDTLLSGPRGTLDGPFNVLLRSPEMGDLSQRLGEYLRYRSSVPKRLNEMAILVSARWWAAQYEWIAHKPLALAAGLDPAIVNDLQAGRRPAHMQPDETAVYEFATELRDRRRVSDTTSGRPSIASVNAALPI